MNRTMMMMVSSVALAACITGEDAEEIEESELAPEYCPNGTLCLYQAANPPRGRYMREPINVGKCYTFDGKVDPARYNDSISVVINHSNYWVRLYNYGWCQRKPSGLWIGPNETRTLNEFNDVTSSFRFKPVFEPRFGESPSDDDAVGDPEVPAD
jgi:hypothetical protein